MTRPLQVAIIGAGPYGLSIAAHLRARGIEHRICGTPMRSWRACMPAGMFLKSEGFASNLYDPDGRFTLQRFCAEKGFAYDEIGLPVPLETFTAYGLAFQRQFVPDVKDKEVVVLERLPDQSYLLRLGDGEAIAARRVVVAAGIGHFAHVPAGIGHLPPGTFSHSCEHHDLDRFRVQKVVVIGGGASALDLLALLHEAGSEVSLVARRSSLRFNSLAHRPWWKRWYPTPALGDGWRNRFYERAPMLFRRLPQELRIWIARSALGPAGGLSVKNRVERLSLLLGHTLRYAKFGDGRVRLHLLDHEGEERTAEADHVIAATGYRVDLRKLPFLSKALRVQLRTVNFSPVLSHGFQSSVPGLYFVGLAAMNTFGPAMRFLVGARYTARHLARQLSKPDP